VGGKTKVQENALVLSGGKIKHIRNLENGIKLAQKKIKQ